MIEYGTRVVIENDGAGILHRPGVSERDKDVNDSEVDSLSSVCLVQTAASVHYG